MRGKNNNMKKYQVLSPDGITIEHDKPYYTSYKKAVLALNKWVENYREQGYYSQICYNGYNRRIELESLSGYCDISIIE